MDSPYGITPSSYTVPAIGLTDHRQPFVDPGHPLHDFFPPRVWAIRIPVFLTLLGSAVVGTFIGIVMINSNKKKAAKAKAAAAKKKT